MENKTTLYDKWDAHNAAESLIAQVEKLKTNIENTTPNEFVTLGILDDLVLQIKNIEKTLIDFNNEFASPIKVCFCCKVAIEQEQQLCDYCANQGHCKENGFVKHG